MKIIHRKIDITTDKEYILEAHCMINYECDTPWKRSVPYEVYRDEWFCLKNQISEFYNYLCDTTNDDKTIAEIIEDENRKVIGYLWVPFCKDDESGFVYADIQDIYIEPEYRKQGIASELFDYVENKAKQNGAKVIRSGTGCENISSIELHKKTGYYVYRYEFEKEL